MLFEEQLLQARALRLSLAAIAVAAAFGGQMNVNDGFGWSVAAGTGSGSRRNRPSIAGCARSDQGKKYSEALARLREADAVPNRTANENFLLEQMRASAALSAGDNGQAIKAIQSSVEFWTLVRIATGAVRRQPRFSLLPGEGLQRRGTMGEQSAEIEPV